MSEQAMTVQQDSMALSGSSGALEALVARRRMINEVMSKVMQKGIDYGTIPGCGDKPALFKPGAEKLCSVFGLAPEFIVEDLGGPDERRYRIRVRILSNTGTFLGEGVGECSTNEEKYRWKGARRAEWDAAPEDRRREKFDREGKVLQVRTNPADVANTVLKMGKKRALVDGVLTVTATSDLLTQDIEEFNAANDGGEKVAGSFKPVVAPGKTPAPDVHFVTVKETRTEDKDGVKRRVFTLVEGKETYDASCFDDPTIKAVNDAMEAGLRVKITLRTNDEGKKKIVNAEAEGPTSEYKVHEPVPASAAKTLKGAADQVADMMQK